MKNSAQKGIVHLLALTFIAGAIAAIFLFASPSDIFKDNFLSRFVSQVSSPSTEAGIGFVDSQGTVITQTVSPKVSVQLTAPWPAASTFANEEHDHGTVAGTNSITVQVTSSTDDVNEENGSFDSYGATGKSVWLGGSQTKGAYSGLRFTNVSIPKGAVITSAKLQVRSTKYQWTTMNFIMAADAFGNSPTFSNSNLPSKRVMTTAQVAHNSNQRWTANTNYTLDEIKSVVQEVVNRSDWQSGNAISLIFKGNGTQFGRKFVDSFNGSSVNAPKLLLSYDDPLPSPSSSPTSTTTITAVLAEDGGFTKNVLNISPFVSNPTTQEYTLSNVLPGMKTVYVKYISSTGEERIFNSAIELLSSPIPSPTQSSSPAPSVVSSGIYGGAISSAGVLGTCSEAVHDKYVVKGPDGGLYRTWHPQIDSSGCSFAHEHGENPTRSLANNTLPAFGYIGKAIGDLEAHPGFKVSVVNEGDSNDEGSVARYSTRVVFHMGTGGVKRYTMPHHSLQFDLVGQGKQVHVLGMADTGEVGSICANPRLGRTVMQLDCQPDSSYEIWEGKLSIAGQVSVTMSMAQFDPITTRDPSDNTKLIYTKDIINKFGSPWGDQYGCDRETYHSPVNFQTSGDGSIQTIYTDANGNPTSSGTGFKQVFSNSSGEVFGSSLIMTYKGGNLAEPMTQMKIHRSQCAPGLGLSN